MKNLVFLLLLSAGMLQGCNSVLKLANTNSKAFENAGKFIIAHDGKHNQNNENELYRTNGTYLPINQEFRLYSAEGISNKYSINYTNDLFIKK